MPYFYKHAMWLNKNEWNRLKTQANPPESPRKEMNEPSNDLIEKSQQWIKTWPDSIECHVNRVKKRKDKNHEKEIAEVKAFLKQKKQDNTKQVIAKARQLIFEGSSYGKQLLSALVASKVIEERELQIAFKKEIKEEQQELEKEKGDEDLYFCKTDLNEQNKQRKKKNVLFALENKNMHETQNAKMKKNKQEESRLEREDATLMQELLVYEKQEEKRLKQCEEEQIRKYEKDMQEFREAKIKREIENDKKIEKAKKEHDRRQIKIKHLQEEYNKRNLETEAAKLHFKLIEKIEEDKRKRFEEFVDKSIKRHEEEFFKKEKEELDRKQHENEAKKLMRKEQQIAIEQNKMTRWKNDICTCDRQCVLAKSHGERCAGKQKKKLEPNPIKKEVTFLSPHKKLVADLRQREKEPSPWSGLSGAHAQFAEQAERTLAECKYKAMAKKVVDEYRRLNNLDAATLPVKNY